MNMRILFAVAFICFAGNFSPCFSSIAQADDETFFMLNSMKTVLEDEFMRTDRGEFTLSEEQIDNILREIIKKTNELMNTPANADKIRMFGLEVKRLKDSILTNHFKFLSQQVDQVFLNVSKARNVDEIVKEQRHLQGIQKQTKNVFLSHFNLVSQELDVFINIYKRYEKMTNYDSVFELAEETFKKRVENEKRIEQLRQGAIDDQSNSITMKIFEHKKKWLASVIIGLKRTMEFYQLLKKMALNGDLSLAKKATSLIYKINHDFDNVVKDSQEKLLISVQDFVKQMLAVKTIDQIMSQEKKIYATIDKLNEYSLDAFIGARIGWKNRTEAVRSGMVQREEVLEREKFALHIKKIQLLFNGWVAQKDKAPFLEAIETFEKEINNMPLEFQKEDSVVQLKAAFKQWVREMTPQFLTHVLQDIKTSKDEEEKAENIEGALFFLEKLESYFTPEELSPIKERVNDVF